MRQFTSGNRTACAVLALAFVACVGGCYGMPRIGGTKGGAGGSGGAGGATGGNSADAGDAGPDADPTGCPATCPGPTTGPTTGSGACINDECRVSCSSTFPTLCTASNACVDLTSDGKNCGTCDHHCLGGACAGGECQPVMIAQYFGHPQIMYVGAEAVYVTTDVGYVGRARKDGSDLKAVAMPGFASSAFVGTMLAEDGDRIFFTRLPGGSVQLSYCLTTNCDSTAMPIGGPYAQYFAIDQMAHKIVWVDYSPSRLVTASTAGTLSGLDVPGGNLTSGSSGSRLFYAQGGVYYADGSALNRIPIAGGSLATITNGTAPLTILGANSSSLFLYDGTAIGSVPLPSGDGGAPKAVIAATVAVNVDGRFAADDGSIYWVGNGQANTCEISNCAGTLKAMPKRAADLISDLGIDADAVYWVADPRDTISPVSTVWKLAR